MIQVNWTDFKSFIDSRSLPIQYIEFPKEYYLVGIDGPFQIKCLLDRAPTNNTDLLDFENNYKAVGNTSFTDSNGAPLSRTKITRTGWHFQLHGVEFCTSQLNSTFNEDKDGNDLGFTTLKFYNSSNVELTAGTQAELDANCIKTVLTWEPTEDIEIIGGVLEQPTPPTTNMRLWATAIPDLTPAQGGSVPFTTGGVNLRYISGNLDLDGKTPKLLPYDATYHTNKFEIVVKHETGVINPVHMLFKVFRLNI
jgi:hypothetical protein